MCAVLLVVAYGGLCLVLLCRLITRQIRDQPKPTKSLGRPYKAVVVVFLEGGADSYNFVIPHSGCSKPKVGGAEGETESHDL